MHVGSSPAKDRRDAEASPLRLLEIRFRGRHSSYSLRSCTKENFSARKMRPCFCAVVMFRSRTSVIISFRVTIDVASPEAGVIQKFVVKERGYCVTIQETKVAVISKGEASVTHALQLSSEDQSGKDTQLSHHHHPKNEEIEVKGAYKLIPSTNEKPKVLLSCSTTKNFNIGATAAFTQGREGADRGSNAKTKETKVATRFEVNLTKHIRNADYV
ncbi:hypothetical protein J5N97_030131 [Dioscorea zingiberensis]|uniref:Uncharacterized protein n=1 Tax=Dioscorea zingiberensis TaxID=325984 RepID=A0A9D5BX37_9LILI|nr:hypothetical protein J5N97_030131 [Dioscorea zingiberensis]